jgi:hypothetical protein
LIFFFFRSYLYHADRSYALVLGRPNAIQDDYTSTLPPLNIEDDYSLAHMRNPPPLSTPTHMTFVILRHALAAIIGRMVHHFQQVRTRSNYKDVLDLDSELMRFVGALPPHYSIDPDTSLDHTHPFLPVHRHLLITEILFVRISLHRPYLLRRLGTDRYLPSRKACFESAIKDFQVRQSFRETVSRDSFAAHSNAYREFQTAMVSGIYLVLDPTGPDATAMYTILDAFLADHAHVTELDETTRRELKIIEFLRAKAREGGSRRRAGSITPPESHVRGANDAQLLLELQRSTSRPGPNSRGGAPVQPPPRSAGFPMSISPTMTAAPTPVSTSSPPLYAINAGVPPTPHSQQQPSFRTSPKLAVTDPYSLSPNSGSPGGDDDLVAQSLLDHWCNTVNGTTIDGLNAPNASSMIDFSGSWIAPTPAPGVGEAFATLDGSDWSYWETLVNTIRPPQ